MFFSGGLQEGISLAVKEGKTVICFVRDDEQTSSVWEKEYFADNEQFARLLETRSVLLRLTKDTPEAGFLTSFCPIIKFPAVVVIQNGTLREYIVPEISKDDFRTRLRAVLDDSQPSSQPNGPQISTQSQPTPPAPVPHPTTSPIPAVTTSPVPIQPVPQVPQTPQYQDQHVVGSAHTETRRVVNDTAAASTPKPRQQKPAQMSEQQPKQNVSVKKQDTKESKPTRRVPVAGKSMDRSIEAPTTRKSPTPTLPKQYRLQVRLFDGSSIRGSFSPSQTIRGDVRPWIDNQIEDEKRPYNLKHILTPLPNRTLNVAEEEQKLENLSLGPTANLVMVPINTYAEAYAESASLPVRAASSAYGLVSSVVGTATGLVGSLFGYGQIESTSSDASPATNPPPSGDGARRPRPAASRGPNIRTLRDQRDEQNDNEFYNGNQLNFEPRRDTDEQ